MRPRLGAWSTAMGAEELREALSAIRQLSKAFDAMGAE